MKQDDIRTLKARAQRLETLINDFEEDVAILYENGVDVEENDEITERQAELQDEIEQVTSDLLLLLDTSGEIEDREGRQVSLPQTGRRPVSAGELPQPTLERPEGRGPPAWAKGSDNGNGGGSGNGR